MHAKQTIVSSDMLKSAVFWHVKPCSLAARYRFGETVDSIFRVKEMFLTNFFQTIWRDMPEDRRDAYRRRRQHL